MSIFICCSMHCINSLYSFLFSICVQSVHFTTYTLWPELHWLFLMCSTTYNKASRMLLPYQSSLQKFNNRLHDLCERVIVFLTSFAYPETWLEQLAGSFKNTEDAYPTSAHGSYTNFEWNSGCPFTLNLLLSTFFWLHVSYFTYLVVVHRLCHFITVLFQFWSLCPPLKNIFPANIV